MAQRSLAKRLWYDAIRAFSRLAAVFAFRVRCDGRQFVPPEGGVLVMSNHQSFLDPVLVGLACDRRLNFLARKTLFEHSLLRGLILSLDAIPIDRDGMGLSGLRETLRRLKRGEMVLIFPEGTRTPDGAFKPLKPGFAALAKRAGASLLPVAMEGAFEIWPRQRKYPWPAALQIQFGPPLLPEEIAAFDDRGLVEEMQRRIAACHREACRKLACC